MSVLTPNHSVHERKVRMLVNLFPLQNYRNSTFSLQVSDNFYLSYNVCKSFSIELKLLTLLFCMILVLDEVFTSHRQEKDKRVIKIPKREMAQSAEETCVSFSLFLLTNVSARLIFIFSPLFVAVSKAFLIQYTKYSQVLKVEAWLNLLRT